MIPVIKTILKSLRVYHPLQRGYRRWLFLLKRHRLRKQYQPLRGEGFLCNCCGSLYSKFAPYQPSIADSTALQTHKVIAGYGENIYCPWCLSTARERLVLAVLNEENIKGKTILHLSPEENIFEYLKKHARVQTADLHPGFYKRIDPAIRKENATAFSFADDSFDYVIANHIMEHIPDDIAAIKEIYRVLKPGGNAIMQVPFSASLAYTVEDPAINDPSLQSKLYGQKDHVRIYTLKNYLSRLESVGFLVNYLSHVMLSKWHHLAIQPEEGFIVIKKPG